MNPGGKAATALSHRCGFSAAAIKPRGTVVGGPGCGMTPRATVKEVIMTRDSILVSDGGHYINFETWRERVKRRRKVRRIVRAFVGITFLLMILIAGVLR